MAANKLQGIYRGQVINTADPQGKGRLYVSVLDNPGTTGWAIPCTAYDRNNNVATPPVGDNVWVMFEGGDPAYPVWLGWFPQ
jgi:hypothetical protein